MNRAAVEVVPLREAAEILGLTTRAAESALRHAGIRSGYPRAAVEWLRDNRPGRGTRTDLKETNMNTTTLGIRQFAPRARMLAALPGATRTATQVAVKMQELARDRRRVGGEIRSVNGEIQTVLTESLASQVACELGLWLAGLRPNALWPSWAARNTQLEGQFDALDGRLRDAAYDTALWLWRDDAADRN